MPHPVLFVIGIVILIIDILSWIGVFVFIASCPAFSTCTISDSGSALLVFLLVIGLVTTYYGWHGHAP
jgi:hypothetical protein